MPMPPTSFAVRKPTRRALLLLAAGLPIALAAPLASADATQDALAAIKKARAGLKNLTAKFTQVRVIGLLADEVKSTGELTVVMPDKLRWELFAPDEMVYWVTSKGVAYKSGSSKKATTAPAGAFGQLLPDLIAFLGGDVEPLKTRYDLSATTLADGSVKLIATPTAKDIKSHLTKLTMVTNTAKWGIASVLLEEPNGDTSAMTFSTNERDGKVPPEKMTPPS